MKIVFLDAYTTNPGDLKWEDLLLLGEVALYDRTETHLVYERSKDAEVIITNKVNFNKALFDQLPKLKCICVAATGFNTIDTQAAKENGVLVCNVVGYSTSSVAQHVFALIFALNGRAEQHSEHVKQGGWQKAKDWTYQIHKNYELDGKTLGIYGLGRIGKKVAEIGLAFGMTVLSTHKHPKRDANPNIRFVDLDTLFKNSDILSLHAPLTSENEGLVNKKTLALMKKNALLINTGRGGLIHELDLKNALDNNLIAGAGLDVLSEEPPRSRNVLMDCENCVITPHLAFASFESRKRLLAETVENVKAYQSGKPRNVVNN